MKNNVKHSTLAEDLDRLGRILAIAESAQEFVSRVDDTRIFFDDFGDELTVSYSHMADLVKGEVVV